MKTRQTELELKLILKRYGSEDEKAESKRLLQTANVEINKIENEIKRRAQIDMKIKYYEFLNTKYYFLKSQTHISNRFIEII